MTGNTIVDFSNPAASTQALAAYQAAGLPTANVVSGTSGGAAASGSAPTTLLGNGFASAHLAAASGETIFVGGFGSQALFGGQGADILTYLAIGDGGDRMSGFDPAKDVIDLSRIDANITEAGLQNFTFIGTAPFSVGAQVRYQLNPTNDTTTVQAALAGDPTADFTLSLAGLVSLTAANFALTAAQSSADLADGAALTYSKVQTAAGAPGENAYSNVQGRAYTSYESFWGSGYQNLAADDLNLSSTANDLVLYDPSLTVTRGAAANLCRRGRVAIRSATIPSRLSTPTPAAANSSSLARASAPKRSTGFPLRAQLPNSIQLATSSFSYLTPGMTQAQDLTAVLASGAKNSSSGLTISDSHGDSLTVAGLTPAMVAANPAMFQFT